MKPPYNPLRLRIAAAFLAALVILTYPLAAGRTALAGASRQAAPTPLLIPIGGGYSEIYAGFSAAAVANNRQGYVNILVLPVPFASNPDTITAAERQDNLRQAEELRFQIQEACERAAPSGMVCSAVLAPIFTRADALDSQALDYFQPELSAVFILGGDPTIGMQVLNGTPVEVALAQAYDNGVIIAGTSAGGGMLSAAMLAGYQANFAAGNALNFGAADLWNNSEKHGLPFGIRSAIVDQHFFQRGRVARLLNAIGDPTAPHVGIGIDGSTGVLAPAGARLEGVFGLYTVAVLDGETYQSAAGMSYHGCGEGDPVLPCTPLISMRNVLVHLLAPGSSSYDLVTRQHSLGAPAARLQRTFDALLLPEGSGSLLLTGEMSDSGPGSPIVEHFTGLAEAAGGRLMIYADGFPTLTAAQGAVARYRNTLGLQGPDLVFDPDNFSEDQIPALDEYDAVLMVARDQSILHPQQAYWLRRALLAGKPVWLVGAAAVLAGSHYAAHDRTPVEAEQQELAVQKSFLLESTRLEPGLTLLDITLEPDVMSDNRWGRLFSLVYNHPGRIAIGLNENSGLEINERGAVALGTNGTFVLDLRSAQVDLGTNQGFVIANGLLDVFAPGEPLQPAAARSGLQLPPASTPALVTATLTPTTTPTVTPTATQSGTPTATPHATRTPRPTSTPPIIPPPSNPDITHWMTAFGMLVVVVILIGLLINRRQIG